MHKVFSSKPQQEYVVKGAMATCMFGAAPAMLNTILDNMFVNFNGKQVATTMSIGPCFPTFGVCNMVPSMPKPCTCMITKWDLADNSVTINRIAHPLTKMSRGQCALGTPMCISFTTTGQFPVPGVPGVSVPSAPFQSDMTPLAQNDMPVNKIPMLVRIETKNSEGKVITVIPENGYVTFVGYTQAYEIGEPVKFRYKNFGPFIAYVESNQTATAKDCFVGTSEETDKRDSESNTNAETKSTKDKENQTDSEVDNESSTDKTDPEKEAKKENFRKNGVSEALINDDDALKNMQLEKFLKSSWAKEGNWLEIADDKDFDPYSKEEFIGIYRKSNKGIEGECLEGYGPADKKKGYGFLSDEEFQNMMQIRYRLYKKHSMDSNTVFQKVVKCGGPNDIKAWVEEQNGYAINNAANNKPMQITGSTLVASDGQHLNTPEKLYDGLQLNYPGSDYQGCEAVYVVRYTADNPSAAKIPVHDIDEAPNDIDFVEVKENKYPFTGNGFTPGTFGNIGTPEVQARRPNGHNVNDGVIVKIDKNGNETIVGYVTENNDGVKQWVVKEDEN